MFSRTAIAALCLLALAAIPAGAHSLHPLPDTQAESHTDAPTFDVGE